MAQRYENGIVIQDYNSKDSAFRKNATFVGALDGDEFYDSRDGYNHTNVENIGGYPGYLLAIDPAANTFAVYDENGEVIEQEVQRVYEGLYNNWTEMVPMSPDDPNYPNVYANDCFILRHYESGEDTDIITDHLYCFYESEGGVPPMVDPSKFDYEFEKAWSLPLMGGYMGCSKILLERMQELQEVGLGHNEIYATSPTYFWAGLQIGQGGNPYSEFLAEITLDPETGLTVCDDADYDGLEVVHVYDQYNPGYYLDNQRTDIDNEISAGESIGIEINIAEDPNPSQMIIYHGTYPTYEQSMNNFHTGITLMTITPKQEATEEDPGFGFGGKILMNKNIIYTVTED